MVGMYFIKRYGKRNWAVYSADELVCVTLYKKGAKRVCVLLNNGGLK